MYLTAMTHRDELFDLALRWLNDDFEVDDGKTITRIFLYESAVSSVVVNRMIGFLGNIYAQPFRVERIRQKHALRERIIQYLPDPSFRFQQLARSFAENPEFFFPRLPVDAALVTDSCSRLAAIARVKRLSRVAEKAAFRLVETLFGEIRAEAERVAEQRASVAGLQLSSLISSEEEMRHDLADAEAVVANRFRAYTSRDPGRE